MTYDRFLKAAQLSEAMRNGLISMSDISRFLHESSAVAKLTQHQGMKMADFPFEFEQDSSIHSYDSITNDE